MTLTELEAKLGELRDQILELADRDGELSDEDSARYVELNEDFDNTSEQRDAEWVRAVRYAEEQERLEVLRAFKAGDYEPGDGNQPHAPNVIREQDPYDPSYQRDVFNRSGNLIEAATRSIGENKRMDGDAQTEAERKLLAVRTDPFHQRGLDEYFLAHSSEAYTRAWAKMVMGRAHLLEDDEKHALNVANQYEFRYDPERGMSLTTAAGGALIPAHLDPTVILVNTGASNPYRRISNVVSINTNVWNGVTSAGVTMVYGSEGGDSGDVAPTFGQVAITCARAHGTIPITIEAFQDIDGLTTLIPTLIADAKDRLEVDKFTQGSGTSQPKGVVTSVYGVSSRRANHATNSAMTVTDITDAQNALGARWQAGASWIASLTYLNRARLLGSSSYSTWSARFDEPLASNILGKPAYEVSSMSTALSSVTNTAFVYGDFSQFNIVDRVGVSIEYIPHLFTTTASSGVLPTGTRGLYAFWRNGSDVTTVTAFVVSSNPGA